jgi:hypothetical protein
MITKTAEVKSKSKVVDEAQWNEYESVAEAVDALGEEKVLDRLNTQLGTDAKNAVRAQYNSKPSKATLQLQAVKRLHEDDPDKLRDVCGDDAAFRALVEQKIEEIKKEMAARTSSSDEGEDSDDDED